MSGSQGSSGSPGGSSLSRGPPYAPHYQGLGGDPEVIPDVPIAAVFLVLYLVFGIIHIKIFKADKSRGHKFIFNGALLGLCKIRVVTMSLRIAWACHPRNVSLGIAANVFVYVGTIILFGIDWFFVQRIVRAQHQRLGWSTQYRIFHRGALVVLITTLLMLIVAGIWQSYTINSTKLHVFRALQLTGQTYFTIFCFAPAVLVLISMLVPRTEIEKFGAGRLRVNITILLISVAILTTGQLFRCVIAWIPQTPNFNSAGQIIPQPWYLHKACFYVFNFLTEIVVIIMFALVRVDLRFHVPNGSRMSGDYSGHNSRVNSRVNSHVSLSHSLNKKNLPCAAPNVPMSQPNVSSETLHQYETSVFEDSHTLADSLQYTGSTLEVDNRTGAWKVKRLSGTSTCSHGSNHSSIYSSTRSATNDRSVTFAEDLPPMPEIPAEWPLASSQYSRSSMSTGKQSDSLSRRGTPKRTFELANHDLNGVDVGDAINDALNALEHNSEKNKDKKLIPTSSTDMGNISMLPTLAAAEEAHPKANLKPDKKSKPLKNPLAPRNRATFPPKSALKSPKSRSSTLSNSSNSDIHAISEVPEMPQPPLPTKRHSAGRPSSVEFITLTQAPSHDARTIMDMSLQGDKVSDISRPVTEGSGVARAPSSAYSEGTTSSDAREAAVAEEEYKRFSYEAQRIYSDDLARDRGFA